MVAATAGPRSSTAFNSTAVFEGERRRAAIGRPGPFDSLELAHDEHELRVLPLQRSCVMLAVFLAATSFAPGAPLRGVYVQ